MSSTSLIQRQIAGQGHISVSLEIHIGYAIMREVGIEYGLRLRRKPGIYLPRPSPLKVSIKGKRNRP